LHLCIPTGVYRSGENVVFHLLSELYGDYLDRSAVITFEPVNFGIEFKGSAAITALELLGHDG
jgi:hypothetical protein